MPETVTVLRHPQRAFFGFLRGVASPAQSAVTFRLVIPAAERPVSRHRYSARLPAS